MGNNYVGVNSGGIVDGSHNTVNNYNSSQRDDLNFLLSEFRSVIEQTGLPEETKQEAKEYIDTIQEEAGKENPKKAVIRLTFSHLKEIATSDKFLKLLEKLTPIIVALIK